MSEYVKSQICESCGKAIIADCYMPLCSDCEEWYERLLDEQDDLPHPDQEIHVPTY